MGLEPRPRGTHRPELRVEPGHHSLRTVPAGARGSRKVSLGPHGSPEGSGQGGSAPPFNQSRVLLHALFMRIPQKVFC